MLCQIPSSLPISPEGAKNPFEGQLEHSVRAAMCNVNADVDASNNPYFTPLVEGHSFFGTPRHTMDDTLNNSHGQKYPGGYEEWIGCLRDWKEDETLEVNAKSPYIMPLRCHLVLVGLFQENGCRFQSRRCRTKVPTRDARDLGLRYCRRLVHAARG